MSNRSRNNRLFKSIGRLHPVTKIFIAVLDFAVIALIVLLVNSAVDYFDFAAVFVVCIFALPFLATAVVMIVAAVFDIKNGAERRKAKAEQKKNEREQRKLSPIYMIDKMSGQEFGEYLTPIFEGLGYSVSAVEVLEKNQAMLFLVKDNRSAVAFLKRTRRSSEIEKGDLKAVLKAKNENNVSEALFLTNSNDVDGSAYKFAKKNELRIYDRSELVKLIESSEKHELSETPV